MKKYIPLILTGLVLVGTTGGYLIGRHMGSIPTVRHFVEDDEKYFYTVSPVTTRKKTEGNNYPGEEVTFTWHEKDKDGETHSSGYKTILFFHKTGGDVVGSLTERGTYGNTRVRHTTEGIWERTKGGISIRWNDGDTEFVPFVPSVDPYM